MLTVKKFFAPYCGPCRALKPIMEQLRTENSGVDFLAIDVDENSDLAQKYNVRAVPTVVIEKNGVEISRLMGMKPKTEYQRIITENK